MTKPSAVVDASVLCAAIFDEATSAEATEHLKAYTLHAPLLLSYEIASVAVKKIQSPCSTDIVLEQLNDFSQMEIQLHAVVLTEQVQLAAQYKLSSYDAAYLWLAAHLKAPLLTFDRQLAIAAKTHLSKL